MNKVIITLVICVCIALCGCGSNTSSRASAKRDSVNVSPNVLVGVIEGGSYYYLVDRNTGVVYLCYNATYQHSITVMLNADGTPVTAEQLGIQY